MGNHLQEVGGGVKIRAACGCSLTAAKRISLGLISSHWLLHLSGQFLSGAAGTLQTTACSLSRTIL